MIRYLLDTNHATAIWRNDPRLTARTLQPDEEVEVGLCAPSAGELWYMIFNSTLIEDNRVKMNAFIGRFPYWEFDYASVIEFGRICAELRKKSRPIPEIDIQIAAIARVNDLVVLTADKHFSYIDQLRTENWLASKKS